MNNHNILVPFTGQDRVQHSNVIKQQQQQHTMMNSNNSSNVKTQTTTFDAHDKSIAYNNKQQQTSSGSETDVSTSTDNSCEEQYALKSGVRQEPQGEETYLALTQMSEGLYSNKSSMIAANKSNIELNVPGNSLYSTASIYGKHTFGDKTDKGDGFHFANAQVRDNHYSLLDKDTHYSNINHLFNFYNAQTQAQFSNVPQHSSFDNNNKTVMNFASLGEITKLEPRLDNYIDVLGRDDAKSLNVLDSNLSSLLKQHLHIGQQQPKFQERLSLSRSHPDLSKFSDDDADKTIDNKANVSLRSNNNNNLQVKLLLEENASLRSHLDVLYKKVDKLQKFELEIQNIHRSHEDLMRSSIKKENLEKAFRSKLEIKARQLQEENHHLKEQLQQTNVDKRGNLDDGTFLQNEINRLNSCISCLISENKEIASDKERQEIELNAQRLTLQEQRNHIDILDTALMNAQNNIITLESELQKKQDFEEKTQFLKKALSNLQLANERRIQMEKRVRMQLEKEIEELKKKSMLSPHYNQLNQSEVQTLKKMVRDYQEKIISLENEVSKWEQKYLEESTLRSIEVSDIRDVQIAALERTSQENDKLITEARSEQLKHMDEIHLAKKRFIELESKLAEKDAMIKVLQKHSVEGRDGSGVHQTLLARRLACQHTRSASTMGLVVGSSNGVRPSCATYASKDSSQLRGSSMNHMVVCKDVSSTPSTSASNGNLETRLSSKDSIIQALRSEKERYPEHYPNWRL